MTQGAASPRHARGHGDLVIIYFVIIHHHFMVDLMIKSHAESGFILIIRLLL